MGTERTKTDREWHAIARQTYNDGEHIVDADCKVATGCKGGTFVQVWVWFADDITESV